MKNALLDKVYSDFVEHPSWTDRQIAKKYNVHRTTILRIRKKFLGKVECSLAQQVAGKFLVEFQQASDYFKIQIDRLELRKTQLEELLTEQKTIFKKNITGQTYAEQVDLDPRDKADIISKTNAIEDQQTNLWKSIIFLARQSEAVEVMRLIQNGKLELTA